MIDFVQKVKATRKRKEFKAINQSVLPKPFATRYNSNRKMFCEVLLIPAINCKNKRAEKG